jgi:hypothetical protein
MPTWFPATSYLCVTSRRRLASTLQDHTKEQSHDVSLARWERCESTVDHRTAREDETDAAQAEKIFQVNTENAQGVKQILDIFQAYFVIVGAAPSENNSPQKPRSLNQPETFDGVPKSLNGVEMESDPAETQIRQLLGSDREQATLTVQREGADQNRDDASASRPPASKAHQEAAPHGSVNINRAPTAITIPADRAASPTTTPPVTSGHDGRSVQVGHARYADGFHHAQDQTYHTVQIHNGLTASSAELVQYSSSTQQQPFQQNSAYSEDLMDLREDSQESALDKHRPLLFVQDLVETNEDSLEEELPDTHGVGWPTLFVILMSESHLVRQRRSSDFRERLVHRCDRQDS